MLPVFGAVVIAALIQPGLTLSTFDLSTALPQLFEQATWNPRLGTSYAAAGMVPGAGYFLSIYHRAFLGSAQRAVVIESLDLRPRELAVALILSLLVLFTGLYPAFILDITRIASESWIIRLQ